MRYCRVNEDKRPQRLNVIVSREIDEKLTAIYAYNRNNEGLYQWIEYIQEVENYVSQPVIAFDYMNRFSHYPNGAIHLNKLGSDISFIIKSNRTNTGVYVYIFAMNLKPEEFGLKIPPQTMNETISLFKRTYVLSESQLRRIIRESLKKVLSII